jgi:hypothetical protein
MRWRIPLVVVLALFVAASCDQQPVEPPAEQVAEAPAFNFTNGPQHPGNSWIAREAGWNAVCHWCETSDPPGSNLYALHYQADDADFCGGTSSS